MMAEGRQELEWDLSNSVMAQIVNGTNSICSTIIRANGGKPKPTKHLDFTQINQYRI